MRPTILGSALALLVLTGATSVEARLSPELLLKQLQPVRDAFPICDTDHDLPEGRYVLRIEVEESGRATLAHLKAPKPVTAAAHNCIAAATAATTFPQHSGHGCVVPTFTTTPWSKTRRKRPAGRLKIIYPLIYGEIAAEPPEPELVHADHKVAPDPVWGPYAGDINSNAVTIRPASGCAGCTTAPHEDAPVWWLLFGGVAALIVRRS